MFATLVSLSISARPVLQVLAVAVVALSCSNVAAVAAPEAKISPQFIAKTDKLCATINGRFRCTLGSFPYPNFDPFRPDRKTLLLVGKHFAKALPIRRAIPRQLRNLGEPATGKHAWDTIRTLALQENTLAIKQVAAALALNSKAFVSTVKQTQQLHNTIERQATAAGFPKTTACGEVF
jgi:hypothetical protein